MNIIGISINHTTAPIEIRESLHFSEDEIKNVIPILKEKYLTEGFILSTCNRTEMFGIPVEETTSANDLVNFVTSHKKIKNLSTECFKRYFSCSAVKHIFNVATGLDSLMLGDSQILGQAKNAFQLSENLNFSNSVMKKIFDSTSRVGKRAINETSIGEGAVTISYAAVQLIEKIFASFTNKKALVIGAGESSELAITHLLDKETEEITITNRTIEKAKDLANKYKIKVLPFDDFKDHLSEFDIIVSATSAPSLIIEKNDIKKAMKNRRGTPIVITDIAIPRDISTECSKIDNVFYNDIDSLNVIVEQNLQKRKNQIPSVEKIIEEEMTSLFSWYNTLSVVPTIKQLRTYFEDLRQDELQKLKYRVTQDDFNKVDDMTRRLLGRLLHFPTMKLREVAENDGNDINSGNYSYLVKELFKLEQSENSNKLD